MPEVGDIRKGNEVGYCTPVKVIWEACVDCGKERWIPLNRDTRPHFTGLCYKCSRHLGNRGASGWGRSGVRHKYITPRGYWEIKLDPDDFFYPMASKRHCVLEHRLVVAKALGRNLHRWEVVHHKGVKYPKGSIEDKQDNRYPENLQLVSEDRHTQITLMERRIKYLEKLLTENGVRI